MRVCILTTSFPLYEGIAVGVHVMEQARHLVKLGVAVDVLAPHHLGALRREQMDGVGVERLRYMLPERLQTLCYGAGIPTNLKSGLKAKCQLPMLLGALLAKALQRGRRCDILHAHWSLAGLAGVWAGKLLGKPVVLMMHGAEVYVLKGNPLIRYALETADCVLCNSSFTRSRVLEISRPKVHDVIAPGVDIQRFHPDADLSRFYMREPDIPRDRPLIFALGKFIERKGFSYLIDALTFMDQSRRPFLMLGGRGPLKEKLLDQVRRKDLCAYVKFLDYIPDEAIAAYHAAADLFVLPSIVDERSDTEGLGVVLLEALACGTPCVASNVGGITDVIIDGRNGFLVAPQHSEKLAEKIGCLVSDGNLRRQMGRHGRQFVAENFSWQNQAAKILRVYERLLRAGS